MNRDQVMADARAAGLVVEPCLLETLIAVRAGEAPKDTNERITNERMRMTSDGALLTVSDGYYWKIGTVEDVSNYLKGRAAA